MNLSKLFEMQKKLDDHIIKEKHLKGQDLLPNKILALQVELGELANEWRGFKHWSNDQKPRTTRYVRCFPCNGTGIVINREWKNEACSDCHGLGQFETDENPLLEEFVDCIHFFLSIGLELGIENEIEIDSDYTTDNAISDINKLFFEIAKMNFTWEEIDVISTADYERAFNLLVGIGERHFKFTWDEIGQAYLDKNRVNHQRQVSGY